MAFFNNPQKPLIHIYPRKHGEALERTRIRVMQIEKTMELAGVWVTEQQNNNVSNHERKGKQSKS